MGNGCPRGGASAGADYITCYEKGNTPQDRTHPRREVLQASRVFVASNQGPRKTRPEQGKRSLGVGPSSPAHSAGSWQEIVTGCTRWIKHVRGQRPPPQSIIGVAPPDGPGPRQDDAKTGNRDEKTVHGDAFPVPRDRFLVRRDAILATALGPIPYHVTKSGAQAHCAKADWRESTRHLTPTAVTSGTGRPHQPPGGGRRAGAARWPVLPSGKRS